MLTLALDSTSFLFFDELRRKHFPAERNLVPAHLCLFHSLPGERRGSILDTLARACPSRRPFPMTVSELRNLGRGVAFAIHSPELDRLHAELKHAFSDWLTSQDKQPFRPHITVQNKVASSQAKELMAILQTQRAPAQVFATGVQLWRYLDGPWELLGCVPFARPA